MHFPEASAGNSTKSPFPDLQPAIVWSHFKTLCDTPRVSKHEAVLRDRLRDWGVRLGLSTTVDAAGNLIIRKPATPGFEQRCGVVLQGHLDMVCQKDEGSGHDFHRDPLRPILRDGWLVAEATTLGADNGIGVALALAALESRQIEHGPLEALFTVDEESGMSGAQGLAADALTGKLLINLDTEEWGSVYLGCAGGMDVEVRHRCATEALPPDHRVHRIGIKGLRGGHSGIDIHLGRGHAIKLLVRLLRALEDVADLRLIGMHGGTARNALPREAWATVSFPAGDKALVAEKITAFQALMRNELSGAEETVDIVLGAAVDEANHALSRHDQRTLLAALHAAPQGVRRMSSRVDHVVETSDNLGVIRIAEGECHATFMVRSLVDSAALALADEIRGLFFLIGARAEAHGGYPGWKPNPDSPLLALFQQVQAREFGSRADVKVIHAGLECGIIGAKYPRMDMISFGPEIRGAHAPGERVEVASVARCWRLLTALLAEIP